MADGKIAMRRWTNQDLGAMTRKKHFFKGLDSYVQAMRKKASWVQSRLLASYLGRFKPHCRAKAQAIPDQAFADLTEYSIEAKQNHLKGGDLTQRSPLIAMADETFPIDLRYERGNVKITANNPRAR